jgi:hypothetical protein
MQYRPAGTLRCTLLLAAALCCGCGSHSSDVAGKVIWAGEPLSMGTISFQPADGHGPTAAAKITGGQFSVRLLRGKYKVQISGYRKVGEEPAIKSDPSSPTRDILQQIVPERYNAATVLVREIKQGQQQEDFLLD